MASKPMIVAPRVEGPIQHVTLLPRTSATVTAPITPRLALQDEGGIFSTGPRTPAGRSGIFAFNGSSFDLRPDQWLEDGRSPWYNIRPTTQPKAGLYSIPAGEDGLQPVALGTDVGFQIEQERLAARTAATAAAQAQQKTPWGLIGAAAGIVALAWWLSKVG